MGLCQNYKVDSKTRASNQKLNFLEKFNFSALHQIFSLENQWEDCPRSNNALAPIVTIPKQANKTAAA
jgi:hypothetical protein